MGKIFILLLVALGAGLYFPSSREVIVETTRPALNPGYRWITNQELRQIVEDLETYQGAQGGLPIQRGEFDVWLDRRYPQERSREDAWGTRYRLEVVATGFRVISAGPDRQFGTDDDLVREGERRTGAGVR